MNPNFGRMVVHKRKNKIMRTPIPDRMIMHKGRMYERGLYISVKWSCVNKRNKSMRTLIFGQMVMHKRKNR